MKGWSVNYGQPQRNMLHHRLQRAATFFGVRERIAQSPLAALPLSDVEADADKAEGTTIRPEDHAAPRREPAFDPIVDADRAVFCGKVAAALRPERILDEGDHRFAIFGMEAAKKRSVRDGRVGTQAEIALGKR